MATWLEDVNIALVQLNGVGSLQDIYTEVRSIRPLPHPESFEAIIRRVIESNSSDSESYNGKTDIFYSVEGLGGGVWGLKNFIKSTPRAIDSDSSSGTEEPQRVHQEIYRILRDTKLAKELKALHRNRCQICGDRIIIDSDNQYSEAHHIRPLGGVHRGPDVGGNIIILCPNHHVLLDYGVIKLDLANIRMHPKHVIDPKYVSYHNEFWGKS